MRHTYADGACLWCGSARGAPDPCAVHTEAVAAYTRGVPGPYSAIHHLGSLAFSVGLPDVVACVVHWTPLRPGVERVEVRLRGEMIAWGEGVVREHAAGEALARLWGSWRRVRAGR